MNCRETTERVSDFLDGALAPEDAAAVRQHTTRCPHCGAFLAQMRVTLRAFALYPRSGATSSRREELIRKFREAFGRREE